VVLHPTPAAGVVADGVSTVDVQSDPIRDGAGTVADGTLLTVTVSPPELAAVLTPDADSGSPGIQVAVAGGTIGFSLRASTVAGRATLRAASSDGIIAGEVSCAFLAGSPAQPAALWLQNPDATAPGPIYFYTGEIRDANGNRVADGTYLTLDLIGAVPVGAADADPAAEGYQVCTHSGIANFAVRTDAGNTGDIRNVAVQLYAEPSLATVIAGGNYAFNYLAVPGPSALAVGMALLAAGWIRCRNRRRGGRRL